MLLAVLLGVIHSASSLPTGGAPCTADGDCQLNGLCTAGGCVCDAAWKGANCSTLNLQPAKFGNGFGRCHPRGLAFSLGVYPSTATTTLLLLLLLLLLP